MKRSLKVSHTYCHQKQKKSNITSHKFKIKEKDGTK